MGIYKEEFKEWSGIALPVVVTYFLEYIPAAVSIIFVGQACSKDDLSAATLATMFVNVIGYALGFGLSTALDPLCSQTFGAQRSLNIGLYLQQGFIITSCVMVPILLINLFCSNLLILWGQDGGVSDSAQTFCYMLLPGMPFLFMYDMLKKALQSQSIVLPQILIGVLANGVHAALCWLFIYPLNTGFVGAAYARSLSSVVFPLGLWLYVYKKGIYKEFWAGWTCNAFDTKGLVQFLKLGIPGMVALCAEWWSFEGLAIEAGLLSDPQTMIDAHTIAFNMSVMTFMVYFGCAVAGTVRVGNLLGANDPAGARRAAWMSLIISGTVAAVIAGLLYALRVQIPFAFSSDKDVTSEATKLFLPLSVFQLCDSTNAVALGIFSGAGRPGLGAAVKTFTYYVVAIPFGAVCAFVWGFGLAGIWWGLVAALALEAVLNLVLIARFDWQKASKEAEDRIGPDSNETNAEFDDVVAEAAANDSDSVSDKPLRNITAQDSADEDTDDDSGTQPNRQPLLKGK